MSLQKRNAKLEERNTSSTKGVWKNDRRKQCPRKSIFHGIIKLDFGGNLFFWLSDHRRSTFKIPLLAFDLWVSLFEKISDLWKVFCEIRSLKLCLWSSFHEFDIHDFFEFYDLTLWLLICHFRTTILVISLWDLTSTISEFRFWLLKFDSRTLRLFIKLVTLSLS